MPDSPGIPGRTRPEGVLAIIGDDRLRLSGYPTRIVPTRDGSRLFAVSTTNVIDILDARTLRIEKSLTASDSRVHEIAISPDGRRVAVAGLDGVLQLWDMASTPPQRQKSYMPFGDAKKDFWLNLSASKDHSRFCVSEGAGVVVYEWTADGLRTVFEKQETLAFKPAIISPKGDRVVLRAKTPSELQLWNLTTSPPQVVDRLAVDSRFPSFAAFRNDQVILAASTAHENPNSQQVSIENDRLRLFGGVLECVVGFAFTKPVFLDDGRRCVAYDTKVGHAIFDSSGETWSVVQPLRTSAGQRLSALGASPDGETLYLEREQLPVAFVRKGKEYVPSLPLTNPNQTLGKADYLAFLRDSTLVISGEGEIHAVSLDEPTRPRLLDPIALTVPLKGTSYLIPHPTDREFAVIDISSPGSLIQVRDRGEGFREIQRFTYGKAPDDWKLSPWSAGYSPDGRTLAVGFWDQSINLYSNSPQGLSLRSVHPNAASGHVCVLTFAPDGHSLACGDFSSNARIFEFHDGILGAATPLPKFGDAVRNAQYSPDGGALMLGSQNGEIRLTDLTTSPSTSRQLLLPGEKEAPPGVNFEGGVTSMEWVGGGKVLMTAKSRRGGTQVGLWKMPDATPLQQWTFTGWMRAAISPDGFVVAVARSDGTVCVMQVSDEVQKWLSDVR